MYRGADADVEGGAASHGDEHAIVREPLYVLDADVIVVIVAIRDDRTALGRAEGKVATLGVPEFVRHVAARRSRDVSNLARFVGLDEEPEEARADEHDEDQ